MSLQCTCKRKHLHSASRSFVRQIGNNLPIDTGKRLYIQLPSQSRPESPSIEVRYAATGERLSEDEEGLRLVSYLKEPGQILSKAADLFQLELISEGEEQGNGLEDISYMEEEDEIFLEEENLESRSLEGRKQGAMDKISALESELAKLKAQIAVYALAETKDLPVPAAPPPPPPPPPALSTASNAQVRPIVQTSQSDTVLVAPATTGLASSEHGHTKVPSTPLKPAMSDILRDIGSVKLRTVHAAKSPGGTPLRRHNLDTQEAADNDPASIIALALRKKFAHKVFQDSPDKENLDLSDASLCGFDSPTVKLQFN